jgi:alkylation response protein AidB-like acyl-CoA dehydrogenase
MDITISKAQLDIAKEARRFLKKECPPEFVREMFEDERGFTEPLWSKIVDLDWPAMCIPEEYGGMGMDLLDLVLVLEETGRALLPGPFFSTVSLGAEIILACGAESQKKDLLPKIAHGELITTLALYEPDGGSDPEYIEMKAGENGDGYILNGTKLFVTDAHVSDFIIVAAHTGFEKGSAEEGLTLFMVKPDDEGVSLTVMPTMDSIRKYCRVTFDGCVVGMDSILGELHKSRQTLTGALGRAQVAMAAESVGGAQWAMETARDYAKMRVQFDQPIGAFQAVKHNCAQMFVDVESARSLLYYAAWAQDNEDEVTRTITASAAKAYCTETFNRVCSNTVQVLGGTGFVWENDIHLYLKRAKANETALGDPFYHRDRIVSLLPE